MGKEEERKRERERKKSMQISTVARGTRSVRKNCETGIGTGQ
jgi:hypothetical protein